MFPGLINFFTRSHLGPSKSHGAARRPFAGSSDDAGSGISAMAFVFDLGYRGHGPPWETGLALMCGFAHPPKGRMPAGSWATSTSTQASDSGRPPCLPDAHRGLVHGAAKGGDPLDGGALGAEQV